MALSTTCPGPVDSLPERSFLSPARSQEISTWITRPSSEGYRNSNQELEDM
jgi:hypothetical protein